MRSPHGLALGVAAAALMLSAATAEAHTVNDSTLVWGYQGPNKTGDANYNKWIDQIPLGDTRVPGFKTEGIDVSYGAGSVILDLYTNWRLGARVPQNGAFSGDLWLDLDQDGSFESAIVFDRQNANTPSDRAGLGFYDGTGQNADVTWKRVFDVYTTNGWITGSKYCVDCTLNDNTVSPDNKPDTLSVVSSATTTPTVGQVQAADFGSGITVTVSGLNAGQLALFQDGFRFGWGTGDCGNDTIVGDVAAVPVPAALPLLLSALIGLGLIARRKPADA